MYNRNGSATSFEMGGAWKWQPEDLDVLDHLGELGAGKEVASVTLRGSRENSRGTITMK